MYILAGGVHVGTVPRGAGPDPANASEGFARVPVGLTVIPVHALGSWGVHEGHPGTPQALSARVAHRSGRSLLALHALLQPVSEATAVPHPSRYRGEAPAFLVSATRGVLRVQGTMRSDIFEVGRFGKKKK